MQVERLLLDEITVRGRHRPLDRQKVETLAESMSALGLRQPISVWTKDNSEVFLVAGHHRLEAAKVLQWDMIDCFFVNLTPEECELWEIDENLIRNELSPAETAAHLARRKEIWEARNVGGASCTTKPQHQKRFAADTAEKTGVNKSTVTRATARAAALGDSLNDVAGTSLDKGVELDALAKMDEPERRDLIQRAKAGEQVSARKPVPPPPEPLSDNERLNQWKTKAVKLLNDAPSQEAKEWLRDMLEKPVFDSTRAS